MRLATRRWVDLGFSLLGTIIVEQRLVDNLNGLYLLNRISKEKNKMIGEHPEEMKKVFKCPLCGTELPEERYIKVIGLWQEQQKIRQALKSQLDSAKKAKRLALEQARKIRESALKEAEKVKKRALEKEKRAKELAKKDVEKAQAEAKKEIEDVKRQIDRKIRYAERKAVKIGIEKGKEREQKRTEEYIKRLSKKTERVKELQDKIVDLEKQLKEGKTAQIAGFDFEKEVIERLKAEFPSDKFQKTGKRGDIKHIVMVKDESAGVILYECKKTEQFSGSFIEQIRQDCARVNANYGVLVTWAQKKGKVGFWIDQEIIIVHPWGAVDVARVLRAAIVEMHTLKLTRDEVEKKGKVILHYMQSEAFKNDIRDTINRSKRAYELLIKETKQHKKMWLNRYRQYKGIYENTSRVNQNVSMILTSGYMPKRLPRAPMLPGMPLRLEEKKGIK